MNVLTPRCHGTESCPFVIQGEWCTDPWCSVEADEVEFPCSVTNHEKRLRKLACCVSGQKPVTLHHCRGGSMATNLFGTPGVGQKQNDALQIPLHATWHVGLYGIDGRVNSGVQSWESLWGRQVDFLSSTSHLVRYSLWTLAWVWASPLVRRRVECFLRESRSRCLPPSTDTGASG